MKILRHNKIWLALAATALIAAASVAPAMAYFTTYVTAKGGYTLQLEEKTELKEEVTGFVKKITVTNGGDTESYVRVKVFGGSTYPLKITGGNWAEGTDGYWYYNAAVPAGADTSVLLVEIQDVPTTEAEPFNVIVVEESTAVLYKADGTAYADWDAVYATKTEDFNGGAQS